MHLGEMSKALSRVEYWMSYPLIIKCPTCGASYDLSLKKTESLIEKCSQVTSNRQGDTVNYPRLAFAAIAALIVFFAWGFLTEGWLLRKDFATSAALYRTSDLQMKYMPFGPASVLVALFAAVVFYAGWCGPTGGALRGLQFGVIMGVFVACIHPIFNLITMNMDTKLGLEIAASNAIGWVLAGVVIGLVYKPPVP
jgi:hypothetical protein